MEIQTPEYQKLLNKFATDNDIFELICILADYADREKEFLSKKRYPEKRELIMKLKSDLMLTKLKMMRGGNR